MIPMSFLYTDFTVLCKLRSSILFFLIVFQFFFFSYNLLQLLS